MIAPTVLGTCLIEQVLAEIALVVQYMCEHVSWHDDPAPASSSTAGSSSSSTSNLGPVVAVVAAAASEAAAQLLPLANCCRPLTSSSA
jgi:hypothetical protein